jgi:hypothetical protein
VRDEKKNQMSEYRETRGNKERKDVKRKWVEGENATKIKEIGRINREKGNYRKKKN